MTPEDQWRALLKRSKTTWIMLHLYACTTNAIVRTLEDFVIGLNAGRARALMEAELDERIPDRASGQSSSL